MHLFRFRTLPPRRGDIGTADTVICDHCRDYRSSSQTWGHLLMWANPQRTAKPSLKCMCGARSQGEPIDHKLTPPAVGREATADEYIELGYDYQREDKCEHGVSQ